MHLISASYTRAAKGHCSLVMIHLSFELQCSQLSVPKVNFPALIATSVVAAPS